MDYYSIHIDITSDKDGEEYIMKFDKGDLCEFDKIKECYIYLDEVMDRMEIEDIKVNKCVYNIYQHVGEKEKIKIKHAKRRPKTRSYNYDKYEKRPKKEKTYTQQQLNDLVYMYEFYKDKLSRPFMAELCGLGHLSTPYISVLLRDNYFIALTPSEDAECICWSSIRCRLIKKLRTYFKQDSGNTDPIIMRNDD